MREVRLHDQRNDTLRVVAESPRNFAFLLRSDSIAPTKLQGTQAIARFHIVGVRLDRILELDLGRFEIALGDPALCIG